MPLRFLSRSHDDDDENPDDRDCSVNRQVEWTSCLFLRERPERRPEEEPEEMCKACSKFHSKLKTTGKKEAYEYRYMAKFKNYLGEFSFKNFVYIRHKII